MASLGGEVCSNFIFVGVITNPTETILGVKGVCFTFQFRVTAHRSGEVKVGGPETAGHTTCSQKQREMNVYVLTALLDLFHSYTVQGSAHELVPCIHRVGFPIQLTLTGRTTG